MTKKNIEEQYEDYTEKEGIQILMVAGTVPDEEDLKDSVLFSLIKLLNIDIYKKVSGF